MTIDRSLKILKNYYHFHWEYDCGDYGGLGTDEAEALKYAIDTMRKYQKIEQIIKDHDNDRMPEDYWYIDEIREVLEDGNK